MNQDGHSVKITDLVNFSDIQRMMDAHYQAAGMPSGIIDSVDGSILAGTGWQDICVRFHRVHPVSSARCKESDLSIALNMANGRPHHSKCLNGLWDIGIPIVVAGMHLATFFLGQFIYEDEAADTDFFTHQADELGFDKLAYLDALAKVPVFTHQKVDSILEYNTALASFIGKLAESNLLIRKQLEATQLAEKELERSKNLIKNILESAPSAIIGIDEHGAINHWNVFAENLFHKAQSVVLDKPLHQALPFMTPHLDKLTAALKKRQTALLERMSFTRDGNIHLLNIQFYPLVANGIEGVVIRIDDVTERERLREMMIQTEKMMSVGGLAAGMAHEINNPLSAIMQSAQMLQRRLAPDSSPNKATADKLGCDMDAIQRYLQAKDVPHFLENIREAGVRASRIVSNMIEFSRKSDSSKEYLDLSLLVDKSLELASNDYDLKKRYDFRHIRITKEYSPDIPLVFCSRMEIEQVLLNLLKNAAQAMSVKTNCDDIPAITLRLHREGAMAVIEVEDNGPGIDDAVSQQIFEPFFTTKGPGEGTGLGLSVSYFIITNNHGGSIRYERPPCHGARFVIELPLAPGATNQLL